VIPDAVRSLGAQPLWIPGTPALVARAPGRLDVMGGIADYSGSLVLQLPLREATFAALQREESRSLIAASGMNRFEASFDELLSMSYQAARDFFREHSSRRWAAYAAGCFLTLRHETGTSFPHGARIFIESTVPPGKGVASSAALAVATMSAVNAAYDLGLTPREVALLCQKTENLVVGAPCGVMDPMTSVFGEANRLFALLCQPAEIQPAIAIPEGLAFWGVDSGIAHEVVGDDYASVRCGAFMGYRMLQEMTGESFGGYLVNLGPSEFRKYCDRLPERMPGAEFLSRYGAGIDSVTSVDASRTYRVRQPAAHPILEHDRIQTFARLLGENAAESAPLLGELMYQSHESYSACGLGSEGTDRLVELAREAGPARGIYGAKITGGGSGGTVAILGGRDAEGAVRTIARRYAGERGIEPFVFSGSSAGAREFGCLVLDP
jgi:L-arabinokinase